MHKTIMWNIEKENLKIHSKSLLCQAQQSLKETFENCILSKRMKQRKNQEEKELNVK